MSEQQLATTVEDWHAQRVGEAVLDALNELDGEVWFDLGCALACDDRFRAAVQDAGRRKSVDRERRLLEAARAALASLEQPETYPADVLAVKKWLTDAVAEYPRPDHRPEELPDSIDDCRWPEWGHEGPSLTEPESEGGRG